MQKIKTILITASILLLSFSATAQYRTEPKQERVKSLQVTRIESDLSYPIIYLNSTLDAISINFDIIAPEMNQITYSVIHCDANWQVSDLSVNEYLDGFQSSYLDNYDYSRSTTIDYVNYQLDLPNDDVRLKLSGNYVVICMDEDEGDTLLTACFSIVDPQVDIYGVVGGITHSGRSREKQQLNFTVSHPNYSIDQALVETKVVVKQNNSNIHKRSSSTPTYIHTGKLVYEQNPEYAFPGGDEYRAFESTSIKYASIGVAQVEYFEPYYHLTLSPDKIRHYMAYEFDNDINGKFIIRREQSSDEDINTEADYTVAHFSLPMEDPILDGKVYLGGQFTYDALDPSSQMIYNNKRKAYETHCMLKQGYYNYRYYMVSNRTGKVTSAPIEMDAYETENDYQIFFYHRPIGERYDQLIGYKVVNTLDK